MSKRYRVNPSSEGAMNRDTSVRSILEEVKNFIFLPLRMFWGRCGRDFDRRLPLGLRPLWVDRHMICLQFCTGRLLDIGCGWNHLVKLYGKDKGIGIDIHSRGQGSLDILCDSRKLPFPDNSFDTVSLLANINHIPDDARPIVLRETRRVLREDGRVLITNINPIVSFFSHTLWSWGVGRWYHKWERGERLGLWYSEMKHLAQNTGFNIIHKIPFVYYLNFLYILAPCLE